MREDIWEPYEVNGEIICQFLTKSFSNKLRTYSYGYDYNKSEIRVITLEERVHDLALAQLEKLSDDFVFVSDIHVINYDYCFQYGYSVDFRYKTEDERYLDQLTYFIERL